MSPDPPVSANFVGAHATVSEHRAEGVPAPRPAVASLSRDWQPPAARVDPVELLAAQNERRDADLVPVRHGRMMRPV
jgi:hypothetical protein